MPVMSVRAKVIVSASPILAIFFIGSSVLLQGKGNE